MRTMSIRTIAPLLILLAVAASTACSRLPDPGSLDPAGDDRGAALARLIVHNQTAYTLEIGYRLAVSSDAEVTVGRVDAGTDGRTAPVPAGEPIVLIARTDEAGAFELPARTLEIDAQWRWIIPADARFNKDGGGT